jgi:hypothetical protein
MKRDDTRPLEKVACCRDVVEHHDPVDAAGAPFQEGHVLEGRFVIAEVLSLSCPFLMVVMDNGPPH